MIPARFRSKPAIVQCLAAAALVGACLLLRTECRPPGGKPDDVRFSSPDELRELVVAHGLHWQPGSRQPHVTAGHFVTDRPVPVDDLWHLCKGQAGEHPSWDGVVWVSRIEMPNDQLGLALIESSGRVWGDVFVTGDGRLMDRIEELYRRRGEAEPIGDD